MQGKAADVPQGWLARRRAKKDARLKVIPALATARAYVARALLYGALLGTGAILLVEYLAAAQEPATALIPLIVLGFIGVLALGFRFSFACLRPRLPMDLRSRFFKSQGGSPSSPHLVYQARI